MRIKKTSELLWALGILLVALGVALCSKAGLGVSMIAAPAFILYEALSPLWSGLSVGMLEYAVQGLILAVLCIILRRFDWRFLLSFVVAVLYGYAINLFLWLLGDGAYSGLWLRWAMLLLGDAAIALGVACFFRTYLPLQVYELFVKEMSAKCGFNVNRTKWAFDASLLLISVVLALTLFGDAGSFDWASLGTVSFHSLGPGTLVTTLINSPLIALMGRLLGHLTDGTARFPGLERAMRTF